MFKNIWNDSVASSVIATAISGMLGLIWTIMSGEASATKDLQNVIALFASAGLPNWAFVLVISGFIGVAVYAFQKWRESRDRTLLSSKEWFSLVNEKLKECRSARIYLRRFDHPDNFRKEHREVLMSMMETIKERIAVGTDIQIISYNENGGKTGFDWLEFELKGAVNVRDHVKIVQQQITTNSSSMYLFDDRMIISNKCIGKGTYYYCETHASSIMYEFVKDGFDAYWRHS